MDCAAEVSEIRRNCCEHNKSSSCSCSKILAGRHESRWELVENVVLSTFSFTKYLMWRDLQDRTDALKENPIAFGPDAAGRMSSQISSLNKKGGHRRLNVAITRARSELLVFATLRPDFRAASLEIRGFNNIPDVELMGLAKAISRDDQDSETTLLVMASALGIGRITEGIRDRLTKAMNGCSGA